MRRRWRTRRVLKWVGTVLCAMFLCAWPVSHFLACGICAWPWGVGVADGGLWLSHGTGYSGGKPPSFLLRICKSSEWVHPLVLQRGTRAMQTSERYVLLVYPLALFVVPTAFLWYLDRRRITPGHCQNCGYNLTGNVSGTCPECGQTTTKEQT